MSPVSVTLKYIVNGELLGHCGRVAVWKLIQFGHCGCANDFDLVIVHEAHNYSEKQWKMINAHFCFSQKLFITDNSTPSIKKLNVPRECVAYELSRKDAIAQGMLRKTRFVEFGSEEDALTDSEQIEDIVDVSNDLACSETFAEKSDFFDFFHFLLFPTP